MRRVSVVVGAAVTIINPLSRGLNHRDTESTE
jgi:hypothetical protein